MCMELVIKLKLNEVKMKTLTFNNLDSDNRQQNVLVH
jgi:hypothetical protein